MSQHSVAMLVGSLRAQSINLRLARAIERHAPASLTFRWVRMETMPYYNPDLEPDRPAAVTAFTDAVRACDAVCIVTPEYNRSIPAVLKNAIDWGSKPVDRSLWRDKVVATSGASPGGIGTALAQAHLRQILAVQGAHVQPGEVYISFRSPDMIAEDGAITEAPLRDFITAFAARLAALTARMAG